MTKDELINRIQDRLKSIMTSEKKFVEVKCGDLMISSPDEELTVGSDVFTLDQDGNQIPLADGEYTLDNGIVITVAAGKIAELKEEATEVEVEQEMEEEVKEEDKTVEEDKKDEVMERLAALEAKVDEMSKKYEEVAMEKEELKKEFKKFSEQPSTESIEVKNTEFKNFDEKNNPGVDISEIRTMVRNKR